jgi:hypothetical protein
MGEDGEKKQMIRNISKKGIILAIIVIAIGVGAWYYFSYIQPTAIEKIISNPSAFTGKEVSIEGEVADRTAIFGVPKFYKVRDKSGEIIVATRRSLPEIKSNVGVKGRIDDAFALGDQKLVVFVEGSVEKKTSK